MPSRRRTELIRIAGRLRRSAVHLAQELPQSAFERLSATLSPAESQECALLNCDATSVGPWRSLVACRASSCDLAAEISILLSRVATTVDVSYGSTPRKLRHEY